MHRNILTALTTLSLAAPAVGLAATYEIDSAHAASQFSVRHMMVSNVRGNFGKTSGTLNFDEKNPTKSSVEATIDVSTISSGDIKRDEHLKSPDFFDAAKFPSITFKSTKVEAAGAGKFKVTGDLSIHGITKPVVLDVDGPTAEVKDPWGNLKRGVVATTTINRKDFGLSWNKALEAGGVAVGEAVSITIDAELNKKVDAPPAAAAGAAVKPADKAPASSTAPAGKK